MGREIPLQHLSELPDAKLAPTRLSAQSPRHRNGKYPASEATRVCEGQRACGTLFCRQSISLRLRGGQGTQTIPCLDGMTE